MIFLTGLTDMEFMNSLLKIVKDT